MFSATPQHDNVGHTHLVDRYAIIPTYTYPNGKLTFLVFFSAAAGPTCEVSVDTPADATKDTTDTSPIRRYEDDGAALPNQSFHGAERTEGTAPIGGPTGEAPIGEGNSGVANIGFQTVGTAPIG